MTAEMITITIDGKELKVRPGTTVLEAAQKAGIHIPTLCHHDDLCAQALYSQSDAKGNDSANKHAESGMLATPSSCRMCRVCSPSCGGSWRKPTSAPVFSVPTMPPTICPSGVVCPGTARRS